MLEGIVVFGAFRNVIISCAGITALAMAGLRAAPLTLVLGLLLGGVILRCLVAIAFFGAVQHIYISYDEVAVQCPEGSGSCSSPALSSIPSKSSEPKSSMLVKSSKVATKWVVGGQRISLLSASHSSRT